MWRLIVPVIWAYFLVFNKDWEVAHYSYWFVRWFGFLVTLAASVWGVSVGEKIRNYSAPDYVYTNGGFLGIIKAKVFWAVGPQIITMIVISSLIAVSWRPAKTGSVWTALVIH